MLRKACSWVSSPLAVNLLLGTDGNTRPSIDKYAQLSKHLSRKEENTLRSRIFISSSTEDVKKYDDLDNQLIDFRNEADINAINDWIQKCTGEVEFNKIAFPTSTAAVLANIHIFKDTWKDYNGAPCMKVYNSFNYTQDVKYESRLLELPTSGDFKFVLLVLNETDVLPDLFSKLKNEGLEAATNSLQPLFTSTTRLEAPSIRFSSTLSKEQESVANSAFTGSYHGNVKVHNEGVNITVLTCLYSPVDSQKEETSSSEEQSSFFFALVFKDTPIFIGQYFP